MVDSIGEIAERARLREARDKTSDWKKWGPYLSERQWGTVREDYSSNGDAWNYLPHDHARSRAYQWGEDGIAGISDDRQILCFALAFWNGKDPIIKERLFGLSNSEGNHGEDVKEYYFYLDNTPTHSYMKYLYKYPQLEFPYDDLVATNQQRSRKDFEYELLDTGVFKEDRYFDIFIEYAKAAAEDIFIRVTAYNRGPEPAVLHMLPTLWFRNTWSQSDGGIDSKPILGKHDNGDVTAVQACNIHDRHGTVMPDHYLYCQESVPLYFTENETNNERLFGTPNSNRFAKDGINDYLVNGCQTAINPESRGTKVSVHHEASVGAGDSVTIRLRLTRQEISHPFNNFDRLFDLRKSETDEFFDSITPANLKNNSDQCNIMRQALAGLLWTKQYFHYDVYEWLRQHNITPWTSAEERENVRNNSWYHMANEDIISMPDKWEYPWYAAWDLAFHILPFNMIDPDFAKEQLLLILGNNYLHPNGQIPAYEWNFGDVNPPVHAFASYQSYLFDRSRNNGIGDLDFLERAFSKLKLNFNWWVNRKDPRGQNIFNGGFLGLDNIGVFDRSAPLPTGGYLEQADGTAWMVFFSQQMLAIALELAQHDADYEEDAIKFFEHTMWIAGAMAHLDDTAGSLWDEEDGFFYDVLRLPDGRAMRLKLRSLVGLLPLAAVVIFEDDVWERLPKFRERAKSFLRRHPQLSQMISDPAKTGHGGRRMISVVPEDKMRRIMSKLFDEQEFLSPFGIRSLSRRYKDQPFVLNYAGEKFQVDYQPGESDNAMFGGNSNWRGPVWLPMNFLIIRALFTYFAFYGEELQIEYPTGSGQLHNLFEITDDILERQIKIFTRNDQGQRPVYGGTEKFQTDPHWKDLILFYEYFQGDNGAGLGASHQTGWTAMIARYIHTQSFLTAETILAPHPWNQIVKMQH